MNTKINSEFTDNKTPKQFVKSIYKQAEYKKVRDQFHCVTNAGKIIGFGTNANAAWLDAKTKVVESFNDNKKLSKRKLRIAAKVSAGTYSPKFDTINVLNRLIAK